MFKIKDAWQIVEDVSTEGTWTDVRDGQVYPYKQFGNQIWMTVNFNYGGKQGDWVQNTTAQSEGHAWRYKNAQDYEDWNASGIDRGAFYTRDSLASWVVPEGWHIPTKAEWDTLVNWAVSEYGDTSKARPALMAKTTKWRSAQTLYSWDDFGLAGFNMIPGGYMGSSTSGMWGDSSLAWNTCVYWVPNSSIATESRVEKTLFNSNTSILYRDRDTWGNQAATLRLIKDSGVYVPQPAISTIVTSLDSTGSDNKIPTEKAIRSAITSAVSSKISNPMTSAGDLIVGGQGGAVSVLKMGSVGQTLVVGTSGLEWGESGGGAVSSIGDTDSVHLDLDENSKLTAEVRVSDTSGNQLEIVTTSGHEGLYVPEPTSLYLGAFDSRNRPQSANTGDYILDTDLGYIIYRYGDAWINATGTVLEGTVEPSVNVPVRWMENPMTSAGDLIVGGADGTPEVLVIGTEGQVLTIGTSGLEWGHSNEQIYTNGVPYGAENGGWGAVDNIYVYSIPFFPSFKHIEGFCFMPYRQTTSDGLLTPPSVFDFCIYEGTNTSNATKKTSLTYNAPSSWSDGQVIWMNFESPVDLDLTKNHWVGMLSKTWGGVSGSYRKPFMCCLQYANSYTSYVAGEMNRAWSGVKTYTSLPDSWSELSLATPLDYHYPWFGVRNFTPN